MNEESIILFPCCSRFCLNVITALSEDALLADNFPAPPLAAMHRSSSDRMLAAVIEDMIRACGFSTSSLSGPRVG